VLVVPAPSRVVPGWVSMSDAASTHSLELSGATAAVRRTREGESSAGAARPTFDKARDQDSSATGERTIDEEVKLMNVAQTALRTRDTRRALTILSEHAALPDGKARDGAASHSHDGALPGGQRASSASRSSRFLGDKPRLAVRGADQRDLRSPLVELSRFRRAGGALRAPFRELPSRHRCERRLETPSSCSQAALDRVDVHVELGGNLFCGQAFDVG
jgi:hypothetical protein